MRVEKRAREKNNTENNRKTRSNTQVWCNQKSKVLFETRSRILYKHVSFIQRSRRDIKVGDATMRAHTHAHTHTRTHPSAKRVKALFALLYTKTHANMHAAQYIKMEKKTRNII